MSNSKRTILFSVIAFAALIVAALAQDAEFAFHAWAVTFMAAVTAIIFMRRTQYATDGSEILAPVETGGYMDDVIRYGVIATLFWGIAGFLAGVAIAAQLAWPELNIEPWFNFGRVRPLHTSAVIFAFGGNALIATSFYVVQRTAGRAPVRRNLARFVFWGYQLFIVLAATGYLLGITQSKEYAEPEWYVDLWLTIVWVSYLIVFVGTIARRKEPHIYVANWFYPRLHHHRGDAARGQQSGDPGLVSGREKLPAVCRRAGCPDAVVVRPQRGRLLPDGGLSRR